MSILIKGIDIPKDMEFILLKVFSDGKTRIGLSTNYTQAIQIPTPHGRLIDRDEIYIGRWDIDTDLAEQIQNAPTILEAEE